MHFVGGVTPIGRNGLSHRMDIIEDRLRSLPFHMQILITLLIG